MKLDVQEKEKQYLQACLKAIEQQLGWISASEWKHHHFVALSDKILDKTQVQLSPVTLKRIWGKVQYTSFPSITTLDTLAQFIGKDNWLEFKNQQNPRVPSPTPASSVSPQKQPFQWLKFTLTAGTLILLGVFIISLAQQKKSLWYKKNDITFDFEPVTTGIPNTVNFHYDASSSNADSVFIQQTWNPRLRHQVNKQDHFFACTYYYPGFFRAKLLLDDEIVIEKNLHIKTDGWLGTIDLAPIPVYFSQEDIWQEGSLKFNPSQLNEVTLDPNEDFPTTSFHLVEEYEEIDMRDFNLDMTFQNSPISSKAICQKSRLIIRTTTAPLIIPFCIKGCTGEIGLKTIKKWYEGDRYDLSKFGVDFSDGVHLEVTINYPKLDIYINDQLAFTENLLTNPGQLSGIKMEFHGLGAIEKLDIGSGDQPLRSFLPQASITEVVK